MKREHEKHLYSHCVICGVVQFDEEFPGILWIVGKFADSTISATTFDFLK